MSLTHKQTLPEKRVIMATIGSDNGTVIKWLFSPSIAVHSASTFAGTINYVSLAATVQHVHYI